MEFYEDGDYVISTWEADANFEGFHDVLHGGIQSTMIDEIASWVVYVKVKTAGVTSSLNVKYKKPVILSKGKISLKAELKEMKRNMAIIKVQLFDFDDILCSEGEVHYFTFPEEMARKKLNYPGYEKLFD